MIYTIMWNQTSFNVIMIVKVLADKILQEASCRQNI